MENFGNMSNSWAQVISCIVNMPVKNTIWSVIQRLVLGASVYFIWKEMKIRIFCGYSRSEDEVFKLIVEIVRYRIIGLNLKVSKDVIKAAKVWNFPIDKISKYKSIIDEVMDDMMDINDTNYCLDCLILVDFSSGFLSKVGYAGYLNKNGSHVGVAGKTYMCSFKDLVHVSSFNSYCTRSNDWDLKESDLCALNSVDLFNVCCLRSVEVSLRSAYGDVSEYGDWSQHALMIQSLLSLSLSISLLMELMICSLYHVLMESVWSKYLGFREVS
ncbi:hypothetical protein Tco_0348764 [Tanacetum coccineum]